jgi:hypothetical protein
MMRKYNNHPWKKLLMVVVLGGMLILLELCFSYVGMHLPWGTIINWLLQVLVVIVIYVIARVLSGSDILTDEPDSASTEEAERTELRKARDERFRG